MYRGIEATNIYITKLIIFFWRAAAMATDNVLLNSFIRSNTTCHGIELLKYNYFLDNRISHFMLK